MWKHMTISIMRCLSTTRNSLQILDPISLEDVNYSRHQQWCQQVFVRGIFTTVSQCHWICSLDVMSDVVCVPVPDEMLNFAERVVSSIALQFKLKLYVSTIHGVTTYDLHAQWVRPSHLVPSLSRPIAPNNSIQLHSKSDGCNIPRASRGTMNRRTTAITVWMNSFIWHNMRSPSSFYHQQIYPENLWPNSLINTAWWLISAVIRYMHSTMDIWWHSQWMKHLLPPY